MTSLRRGFKTEANAHALTMRRELRLDPHDALCPWRLAEHLNVPVITLSQVEPFEPVGVRYLKGTGSELFSAVTIFVGRHGRKRLVVHNDGHAKTRQAANLAHELAHAILGHPPTAPFFPDATAEAEAHWLGPTLLVSEEAALLVAEQKLAPDAAARIYGVSPSLLIMRLNVTGAVARIARRRRG